MTTGEDEDRNLSEEVFLGRLVSVTTFVADIAPVAELVDGHWVSIDEPLIRFPKRGLVRAEPSRLGSFKPKHSLWLFRRKARTEGKYEWEAEGLERAKPLVDLSNLSLTEAKRTLLEVGVALPQDQTRHAVVLLPDGAYCDGQFERKGTKWVLKVPPDGCVELRAADDRWRESVPLRDGMFWPVIGGEHGVSVGKVDWTPDKDFLHRFVDRYGRAVSAYFSYAEGSQDAPLKRLERLLSDSKLAALEAGDLEGTAQRLKGDWPNLSKQLKGLESLTELLFNSGQGRVLLEEAVRQRTEELSVQIETSRRIEIEAGLASVRSDLDCKRQELGRLDGEKTALVAEIATLAQRADESVQRTRQLEQRLSELKKSVEDANGLLRSARSEVDLLTLRRDEAEHERVVAERAVTEATNAVQRFVDDARTTLSETAAEDWSVSAGIARTLEALLGPTAGPQSLLPSSTAPWAVEVPSQPEEIGYSDLNQRLEAEAQAHGFLPDDLAWVDALSRAGELVLLTGPHVEYLPRAYARVVSGGNLSVMPLDPSVIGLDDLWRTPVSNRPTPLAFAWHRALTLPRQFVVLLLQNLDAAPFRLWAGALFSALQSPRRPKNLLVLATAMRPGSGQASDEEFESLRHSLVAVYPRAPTRFTAFDIITGEVDTRPAVLRVTDDGSERVTRAVLNSLAANPSSVITSKRAMSLFSAMQRVANPNANDLAKSFATYLTTGTGDGLPEPLKSGHESLANLSIQR